MNLYLIERPECDGAGYEEYDSAVVCANTEDEAKMIHPSGNTWDGKESSYGSWVDADKVRVTLIGTAITSLEAIVCASFNAG